MDKIAGPILLYLVFFATGFPFLFFCAHAIWLFARHKWSWDRKRKLLLLNAVIYPFILAGIFLLLVKVFGVSKEVHGQIEKMDAVAVQNIREGAPPSQNNVALGTFFLGGLYAIGTLIPTVIVAFIYSAVSTFLLVKADPKTKILFPFIIAVVISLVCILIGFIFRTPIFNWLQ